MIKILYILSSLAKGGTEQYVMNCYRMLDRKMFKFFFCVLSNEKRYYEEEIEKNGDVIYHISSFRQNPVKNIFEFKNIIKKEKFDIMEIHSGTSTRFYYAKLAKKEGIKTVIYHAHNTSDKPRTMFQLWCANQISKYCDYRIACSEAAGKYIFNKDNYIIIKNAINLEEYKYDENKRINMRKTLNIEKNEFLIGFVGRLEEQKNPLFLIDVLKDCLKESSKVKLIFVGDGSLRKKIELYAERENVKENIIITGVINNVNDYYQAMDVFVMPSKYEGLPYAGIEAQAMGLPCIFSNEITHELKVTPDVKFLSLTTDIKKWKESIFDFSLGNIRDTRKCLIDNGYDLTQEMKKVFKLYIESVES